VFDVAGLTSSQVKAAITTTKASANVKNDVKGKGKVVDQSLDGAAQSMSAHSPLDL
jgi:hypothetical protein